MDLGQRLVHDNQPARRLRNAQHPSATTLPAGRLGAASWSDRSGNFWLFGGDGLDAQGTLGMLNDLWRYTPSTNQWTWMAGSNSLAGNCFSYDIGESVCGQPGVSGTLGSAAAANLPRGRTGATTWTDNNGDFWLFGGWGFDIPNQVKYFFNDLWKFSPTSQQWTWVGGSTTGDSSTICFKNPNLYYVECGDPGVYGNPATPSTANAPGSRDGSLGWTDTAGNLWLFGGQGFDSNGQYSDLNDLWKFNPADGTWTWIGGPDVVFSYYASSTGVYGTLGSPSGQNLPPTRYNAATWRDTAGNLWLFGGEVTGWFGNSLDGSRNDIWRYNIPSNQWTWMGGSDDSDPPFSGAVDGAFGVLGVPAPGNVPGQRNGMAFWPDLSGNFWLFGGRYGNVFQGGSFYANDLWQYQPSTATLPTAAAPTFSVPPGTYSGNQTVTLSDATDGSTIYYTTDGSTPTLSSLSVGNTPVTIPHSETLKAFATASGCFPSPVASAVYTLPAEAAPPTFSVPAGTYNAFQTVALASSTPGASIFYNFGGNEPPIPAQSTLYTGPITVPYTETIYAIAIAPGYSNSALATSVYTLNLPTAANPTFSVADGTYATTQTVTVADATPGSTIYIGTGTYPSGPINTWPVYTGPITVSSSETIWSIALAPNYLQSDVVSVTYTIGPLAPAPESQAAAPTFSIAPGTYATAQTVVLATTTPGATLYYRTDGGTPSSASPAYTAPLTVASTETITAIALAPTYTPSTVATAAYTINLVPADFSFSAAPTSLTLTSGSTGTVALAVTPLAGFNAPVSFTCSGLPAGATCSFAPATVTPSGVAASTSLTVTTPATSAALSHRSHPFFPKALAAAALCLLFCRRRRLPHFLLLVCCAVLPMLSGCGSGGSPSSSTTSPAPTTPTAVTSTVTITATSGSLAHTTILTLTVQ